DAVCFVVKTKLLCLVFQKIQILLYLSAAYSVFYFLSTLSRSSTKVFLLTYVLSYPDGRLALDMCLLFLMASLEVQRVYWGVRGNLQESESYTASDLIATGATVLAHAAS
uniref:Uncharacterized protein n=1 Tax=Sinocyclocheilus grahami TaxID=75366 RepID=A0A672RYB0_SINGR